MQAASFDGLDVLTGEVLPERAMLGVVSTPFNNAGGAGNGAEGSSSSAAAASGGGAAAPSHHGAVMMSACQSTHAEGTPGLLGSLGLGSNNPGSTMTCTPAGVATY